MEINEIWRELGDKVGNYVWKTYVQPRLTRMVSFYRASVTAPASGGKITVQQPYNAPQQVLCAGSAEGLAAGDQCVVLVFGDPSNAIVLSDGTLSTLGSGGGGGGGSGVIVLQDSVTSEKYMLQVKNGRLVLLGVAQDFVVSGAELVDQETGIVYNLAVANGRLLIEEVG